MTELASVREADPISSSTSAATLSEGMYSVWHLTLCIPLRQTPGCDFDKIHDCIFFFLLMPGGLPLLTLLLPFLSLEVAESLVWGSCSGITESGQQAGEPRQSCEQHPAQWKGQAE